MPSAPDHRSSRPRPFPRWIRGALRLTALLTWALFVHPRFGDGTLPAADLAGPAGLGYDERAGRCGALAVPTLTDAAGLARCLTKQHACRVRQLLELQQPRLDELLGLGQVSLP